MRNENFEKPPLGESVAQNERLEKYLQEALQENPPLSQMFSPEAELARIKKMPKSEKEDAILLFKDNLAKQRRAWADCRIFIEGQFEKNPDVPKEQITAAINSFGNHYGFTDEQKQLAERFIDSFYGNRLRMKEVIEKYPDNTALVNCLTGLSFGKETEFDISLGTFAIEIKTDDLIAGRIFAKDMTTNIPLTKVGTGGAFTSESEKSDDLLPIPFTVFTKRASFFKDHEIQHQKNRVFGRIFDAGFDPDDEQTAKLTKNLWDAYCNEEDDGPKRSFLEEYMKIWREYALAFVKDEILAIKKQATLSLKLGISSASAVFLKEDNGPYDYLSFLRDYEQSSLYLYKELCQKICIDEYAEIIKNADQSFNKLASSQGYSTEKAIAILTDKPLTDWPKTVKRQLNTLNSTVRRADITEAGKEKLKF
ncbi:MAG: hypothetical protein PHU56_03410 [Candidatus Pacebacteria bacterium]|nr:hypothetical protein [Candidatus Paceibacterota bacterium]